MQSTGDETREWLNGDPKELGVGNTRKGWDRAPGSGQCKCPQVCPISMEFVTSHAASKQGLVRKGKESQPGEMVLVTQIGNLHLAGLNRREKKP